MKQNRNKPDNSNIINSFEEISIFVTNIKKQTKLKNIKQIY